MAFWAASAASWGLKAMNLPPVEYPNFGQLMQFGQNLGKWNQRRQMGDALQGNEDLRTKAQRLLEMGRIEEARAVATIAEAQRRTDTDALEARNKASVAKPMPAAVMRQYNEANTNITNLGNTIKMLEEAEGLLGKDEKGIHEGILSPAQTIAGTQLNVGGALEQGEDWVNKTLGTNFDFINKDKSVKTSRFQQIMEAESLKTLSRELKGPTAVQEVMTYKDIVANPKKTNAERAIALKAMIALIKNDLAAQGKSIENIEKVYGSPGAATGEVAPDSVDTPDPEQLRAWAQEAIEQGADPAEVEQMLREYGVE